MNIRLLNEILTSLNENNGVIVYTNLTHSNDYDNITFETYNGDTISESLASARDSFNLIYLIEYVEVSDEIYIHNLKYGDYKKINLNNLNKNDFIMNRLIREIYIMSDMLYIIEHSLTTTKFLLEYTKKVIKTTDNIGIYFKTVKEHFINNYLKGE